MVMWKVKSCPRCGGDVFIEQDLDGWYELCLQCSHRSELRSITQSRAPVVTRRKRRKKQMVL